MHELFVSLIVICAAVAAASFMAHPRFDNEITRFALGILLIAAVLAPLGGAIDSLDFTAEAEISSSSNEEYISYIKEAYENGIKLELCSGFSLGEDDFKLSCLGFNIESMKAEKCRITVYKISPTVDYNAVRRHVLSLGINECEVEYL